MNKPQNKKGLTPTSRKSDISSLKDVIDDLIEVYRLRGRMNETTITSSWEKLMGKSIAARTEEIYVRNGKLFLKITSAPLKNELSMSKSKIIQLVNKEVGTSLIEDVVFL